MSTFIIHSEDDSLTHYGVKGMKWRKGRKTGLHLGYNEEVTQLLREEAARRNAMRAGKTPPPKSDAYKAAERSANRKKRLAKSIKSNKDRVSRLFSKARSSGNKTLKSSTKTVAKGAKRLEKFSKKTARKVEKAARWKVYEGVHRATKSRYSPQDVVKLPKKKREKEYAKNRRAHRRAVKVSGINKYGVSY